MSGFPKAHPEVRLSVDHKTGRWQIVAASGWMVRHVPLGKFNSIDQAEAIARTRLPFDPEWDKNADFYVCTNVPEGFRAAQVEV